jgi:uncharacterized protein YbaR (Trm112 family)
MPAESNSSSFVFDDSVAGLLACPACLGSLCAEESSLLCTVCGRAYPVVDGIPVLITERATAPTA